MPSASRIAALAAAAMAACALAAPARACTITTTPVAFGTYNSVAAAPTDGVGGVTLRCHPNVKNPDVAISAGFSGNVASRRMRNGVHQLNYNLYTSAARIIVWGDGTGGSSEVGVGDGYVVSGTRIIEVPIFGRIFPQQQVAEGTYGDALMITVTF